jgi:uncharacterized OsmC-like protein
VKRCHICRRSPANLQIVFKLEPPQPLDNVGVSEAGRLRRPTTEPPARTAPGKDTMMAQVAQQPRVRNGVDVDKLFGTLDVLKSQPDLGRFQFRARNRWLGGAHNRSTIKDFYAAGQEDRSRSQPFDVDAGEPAILLGTDTGPNPVEYLLHALAACLTTTLVYSAAARGVELEEVESTLEGDIDVLGALGLSNDVRNGFERIRVTFHVKANATPEKIQQIVDRAQARSAVFDSITRGVPVEVRLADA